MPTSWLAFGAGVLGAAWTAAADVTNDGAAAAHNRATIRTLRAVAPTLAFKVLVMGAPTRAAAAASLAFSEKGLDGPYSASSMETAKMLQRHADVKGSFTAGNKPFRQTLAPGTRWMIVWRTTLTSKGSGR